METLLGFLLWPLRVKGLDAEFAREVASRLNMAGAWAQQVAPSIPFPRSAAGR